MTKEKFQKLEKYADHVKSRLAATAPQDNPRKAFWEKELRVTIAKLTAAKLEGTK